MARSGPHPSRAPQLPRAFQPSFSPDERCLIGVSGGRDSVALLHWLLAAGFKDLVVCHLDHRLRAESADEARFVRELAVSLGLEFKIGRIDVSARAKRLKVSLETASREARHQLFAKAAREHDCPRLFLAHHADDQVETFLFNLFRGSAVTGLAAMRPISAQKIGRTTLQISRPLLGVWRQEIDAAVAAHGWQYCEDASNADPQYTRNRLRHELIPAIERSLGRDVRKAVWRAAETLRAEDELLAGHPVLAQLPVTLSTIELRAHPLALQRRLIYAWLKARGVPEISYDDVEAVRALLDGAAAKCNLSRGWHARRRAKQLFIE